MSDSPVRAASPVVREACQADVGGLVSLYQAARGELSEMRGGRVLVGLGGRGQGEPEVAASFARQLGLPGWRVVVGGVGLMSGGETGEVVGYGTCRAYELSDGELLGSIEELYVKPEARRHGVGRAIAASLVSWCAERGCSGVDAKALPGSRAVKSFFEAEGFTARLLVMHRRLG